VAERPFWRQLAAQFPHALFSVFYPEDCRICSSPLVRFSRVPVCPGCLASPRPLDDAESRCSRCGLPFENPAPLHGAHLCGLCRRAATEFDWGRGWGAYEGPLRQLIHLLKYDGMRPLAAPLAARLAEILTEAGPVDLLVPVPLDRGRQRRRGFNQSELLARELSRITALPWDGGLLRRERATETQTGLTYQQRRLNVRGAFRVRRPERVLGKRIALVDDVITTGATAGACSLVLRRAGATRVVVVALARARRRGVEPKPEPLRREAACGV